MHEMQSLFLHSTVCILKQEWHRVPARKMNISSSQKKEKRKCPFISRKAKKRPSILSSCSSWDCLEQLNSKSSQVVPTYTLLLNKLAQSCCVQCDTHRRCWWRAQRRSLSNITKRTRRDGAQVARTLSCEDAHSLHPSWYLYIHRHRYMHVHLHFWAHSFFLLEINKACISYSSSRVLCCNSFQSTSQGQTFWVKPRRSHPTRLWAFFARSPLLIHLSPPTHTPLPSPARLLGRLHWEQMVCYAEGLW